MTNPNHKKLNDRSIALRIEYASSHAQQAGLLALLFIAPLFMGGRHPLGQLVFVGTVFAAAAIWLLVKAVENRAALYYSNATWLLVAAIALVVLQLIPLPKPFLDIVSPSLATLLPVRNQPSAITAPAWRTISLAPTETRQSLVILLSYCLLFALVIDQVRTYAQVQRILCWMAAASAVMALLGIVQLLFSNGRFLWIYAHPTRETFHVACGPFANANHFAHFVVMGVPAGLWCLLQYSRANRGKYRSTASVGLLSVLCVSVLAIGLSVSRGGMAMLFVATSSFAALAYHFKLLDRKMVVGAGVVASVCVIALAIHGLPPLMGQLKTLTPTNLMTDSSGSHRVTLWTTMCRAIPHFARFGAGAGSHRELYPTFLRSAPGVEYTHGENGYLQVFEECGVLGLAVIIGAIFVLVRGCCRLVSFDDAPVRMLTCALVPALLVSISHSLFDFVWYLPSCMTLTILTAALVVATSRIASGNEGPRFAMSRAGWMSATVVLVVVGFASCRILIGDVRAAAHWDNYLTMSLASKAEYPRAARIGRLRYMEQLSTDSPELLERMIIELSVVVARNSGDSRAHARLASLCLQKFDITQKHSDNPMGLNQIREAAYSSDFASQRQLRDWLRAAFGDCSDLLYRAHHHAMRAVELCPLHGEAYLYLAELSFLDSPDRKLADEYLTQARLIRPVDGSILIAAGQERALVGDVDCAFRLWRRAFRLSPDHRAELVGSLGLHVPVTTIMERLQPDRAGMMALIRFYKQHRRDRELQVVGTRLVLDLKSSVERDEHADLESVLGLAADVLQSMPDPELACSFYRATIQRYPYDYDSRWMLSQALIKASRYDEAVDELRWCQRKRPGDERISQSLHVALGRQFR